MPLSLPASIPVERRTSLTSIVTTLAEVPGMAAIVLGGSYARGTYHSDSDLDLGLYYSEASPFLIEEIQRMARQYADGTPPIVTDFYEWGPWVNGGAWIQTPVGKVDFLYRSIEHVERTIQEAMQGAYQRHYDQQPTFGFYNIIYLAETSICVPLFDPQGVLARLKQAVAVYPSTLQQTIVGATLWGAEFAFFFAHKFAAVADVYNTVGCLSRIADHLTQALFALNKTYFLSDKRVLEEIARFEHCPFAYGERISGVLACPGDTTEQLSTAVTKLQTLWQEVVELAGALYTAKYPLSGRGGV